MEQLVDLLLAKNLPGLVMDQILLAGYRTGQTQGRVPGRPGRVRRQTCRSAISGSGKATGSSTWVCSARPGSGKTTLAMRLLKEICNHDKPFLIFDYKRNYRDLLNHP